MKNRKVNNKLWTEEEQNSIFNSCGNLNLTQNNTEDLSQNYVEIEIQDQVFDMLEPSKDKILVPKFIK